MARNMKKMLLAGAAALLAWPAAAQITLNFEGINAFYPQPYPDFALIGDFYNGGTSNQGTSGTNYGVSFSANAAAICLNTPGATCSNASRGGFGDPNSQQGALGFADGDSAYLNVSAGFGESVSFTYSAPYDPDPGFDYGSISVYDGLNGTGNLLATLTLATTPQGGCDFAYSGGATYCPFVSQSLSFAGTARSILFSGVADFGVVDDVTLGAAPTSDVPEPANWALMLMGFAGIGGALRSRRREDGLLAAF